MILSDISIRRPVAMSCLIIGLALLGLNSWRKMGLELMPRSDLPFITIATVYPGASPAEIETDIAKRIEDSVGTIDGLKHISSVCMENVCQTLLEFELGVNVDIAATDVREKLDLVRSDFPADAEDPVIQKYDVNAKPIVTLALTGSAPLDQMYDYADNSFRDRVSIIRGVADVEVIGGAEREVHITLDRKQLAARGLTSLQVIQAVQDGVRLIPVGRIRENDIEYNIKFDADYREIVRIENLELAGQDGRRCYIRDVGRVEMGTEELRQISSVDGKPCVAIRVIKKSDANAVAVARGVRKAFDTLERELPGGMELLWISDDGTFIEASNVSAWTNVLQGILLTGAILFLFLYNARALLVVCISMPLTILIGLFFMQIFDMTLNTSTLIAIGLSIGILVTNSIVVMEAIVGRLNEGSNPKEAARLGAKESFVAVLASAGTNMVVLFPLAMMGSLVGIFLRPLALTMLLMTVVSLFLSFTLTPMLCSLLLKPKDHQSSGGLLHRMEETWNRGFDRIQQIHRRTLVFNERHRWAAGLILVLVGLMFLHALHTGGSLGFSFSPETDKGEMYIKLEFPTRTSLESTREQVDSAVAQLGELPGLRHILVTIGKAEGIIGQSSEGVNLAQIFLRFNERTQRRESIHDLLAMVRARLRTVTGSIVTVSIPTIMGGQSSPIELEITGPELHVLDSLALKARDLTRQFPGFRDVDTSVREGKPELRITPKRAVLADMNIPATSLGMNLRANVEGVKAGTFKSGARSYDIVVKLDEEPGKNQVAGFQLPGAPGRPVALTALADINNAISPAQITRKDKQRAAMLYSQLDPELPIGTAMQQLGQGLKEEGDLPPGYSFRFSGMGERMTEAMGALGEAGLVAIVLVILTLAAILESYRQTALILVTLPLGLIGMLWALAISRASMDIFAIMGGVMLIGIVVNNAILIMDRFNVHVREGTPRHKAMITATIEQFRPIVMITIAAVLGMLPLALSRGIGGELRINVGIASLGGILVSGILTIIVMPILYDLFTRRQTTARMGDPEGDCHE